MKPRGSLRIKKRQQDREVTHLRHTPEAARHARYRTETARIPYGNDNAGSFKVSRNIDINLMDSWVEYHPFGARHLRMAHHCRDMWLRMPTPSNRVKEDENQGHARAAKTLSVMKRSIDRGDWEIFENAMRWNEPGGYIGSRLVSPRHSDIELTKAVVKRVLEWISR